MEGTGTPTRARPGLPTPEPWVAGAPKRRRWPRRVAWGLLALLVLPFLLAAGAFAYLYVETDLPATPDLFETTRLVDRKGREIGTLPTPIDRTMIDGARMPEVLRQAVIATEDRGFYDHPGISVWGIARAAWSNFEAGDVVEGGSTITQQYVKNIYTGNDRTYTRKIREAILAMKLESAWTKEQILAAYLNTVYLGHQAYGVEAAANAYWGRHAADLNPSQAATLAGVIAAPSDADPLEHPKEARRRRDATVGAMVQEGYLTPTQAARIIDHGLALDPPRERTEPSDFFATFVSDQIAVTYGPSASEDGLEVRTTLDLKWQALADKVVQQHLPGRSDPEAAVVVLDVETGAIRVMVGGRDFSHSEVNLATNDCDGCVGRQAGSAFKVFTLTAAIESGISARSVWKGPSAITIRDPVCGSEPWRVANYADADAGTMELIDATAGSVNTIFAQVIAEITPAPVVDVAHRMGITSPLEPVCSITLGSQSVTPLEMTTAYATLAARGIRHDPVSITGIQDPAQRIIGAPPITEGEPAVNPQTVAIVTTALEGVVDHGTGVAADLGRRPVAGKTGTAQDYTDAWFCGFTTQLAACVWVGYPKAQIPMRGVQGLDGVTGGSIPAEIWHDLMIKLVRGDKIEKFPDADLGSKESLHPNRARHDRHEPSEEQPAPVVSAVPPVQYEDPGTVPATSPRPSPRPSPSPSLSPGARSFAA